MVRMRDFKHIRTGYVGKKSTWIGFIFTLVTKEVEGLWVWTFKRESITLDELLDYYSTNLKAADYATCRCPQDGTISISSGASYACHRGERN